MATSVKEGPTIQSPKSFSRLMIVGAFAFIALADFFIPLLFCFVSSAGGNFWNIILVSTWILFHLAAIATVAGLVGKSWLAGLFAGFLGFVLFAVLSITGMSIGSRGSSFGVLGMDLVNEPLSSLCSAFVIPWIVMVCSLPFYLARFLLGWRLSFGLATAKREPLVVVDFFLLMTSVACALWMTTAPRLVIENGNELSSILPLTSLGLVWGAINALVVLPSVYFAYRIKSCWTAGLLSFLSSMLAPVVLGIVAEYYRLSNFVFILIPSVFACSIFTLALILLRRIGFVLQRYEPKSATVKSHVPLKDVEEFEPTRRFFHNVHFRWTALFAMITLVSSFTIVAIRTHRKNVDQSLAELQHSLGKQGVAIETRNREVVSLVFASDADRRLLESFEPKLKIISISLSGGPLPQDLSALLARYPNLSSLDLSNTGLNESQLNELNFTWKYPRLVHLSIAGNPLTPESILRLVDSGQTSVYHRLRSIDLSNLGLKDEDLSVAMLRYSSLNLSRNHITDKGLADFLRIGGGYYQKLDVSGNPIDGSAFNQKLQVNELILDGCPLTDSTFSPALVQFTNSTRLILKNTQLTDSFLTNLSTNIYRLELGDGNFTDKGVSDFLVNATSLYDLSLTGKQFTGSCFRDWQQSLSFLSMKGSGLVDENVGFLPTVFGTLNLSDTTLTDIGLAKLKPNVYSIDLSNTAVTVKGILNSPLPPRCNIRLSQGQFSAEDIELLRTKHIIALDPTPEQY